MNRLRVILIVVIILVTVQSLFSDWQSTLAGVFDIVYTFDDFTDWAGTQRGMCTADGGGDPIWDMPKIGAIQTLWRNYCQWHNLAPQDNWIGSHSGYNWRNEGKSLCINYARFPTKDGIAKTYGPSAMGLYLGGGSPTSGYNEIYLFFMVKFHSGFFHMVNSTTFYTPGIMKFLEIETGFRGPGLWGTVDEFNSACNTPQVRNIYGCNGQIFDLSHDDYDAGSYMGFWDNVTTASWTGSCYEYVANIYGSVTDRHWHSINFGSQILAGQWIGMEFRSNVGSVGVANGSTEIWIYDEVGNVIGTQSYGTDTKKRVFNHVINKIVWGVNRIGLSYDEDVADSDENRMYIDDVIIDNARIGPTYFNLLKGEPPPVGVVTTPTGLRVIP